jgi:hypothetical protein
MQVFITGLLVVFSLSSFAKKGPFPHERSNSPRMSNMTSGRYIYLGDAPKFDGNELEITVSKMNLSTRVTAHVHQKRIDSYAQQLFMRWKTFNDGLSDPALSLHPLVTLETLSEEKPDHVKAWAKIASQYSGHVLEGTGENIYEDQRNSQNFVSASNEDAYKRSVSNAYFKFLFKTQELPDNIIDDSAKLEKLLSAENSRQLFQKNLGHLFTKTNERKDYVGFLTFVYPIAATTAGPFDQPKEMITDLKTAESIEARWWSDKWKDEFGGFPFLLIEYSGVAFHGPITNYSPLETWYLRRDYVSHGCHRMDSSDVLELRTLMPTDLKKAAKSIKVTILDYFDVTDWNRDGEVEAIDVKYYKIPTALPVSRKSVDEQIAPYLVEAQSTQFLKNNKYAAKYVDSVTGDLVKVPKYAVVKGKLVKDGVHQRVKFHRFDYRPNRVIQYTEDGIRLSGYDDVAGKYPPKFFQKY